MIKKMTAKEFWKIIEESGMYREKNYEDILNSLVSHEFEREKESLRLGCEYEAKNRNRIANYIYDILEERGYYDFTIA